MKMLVFGSLNIDRTYTVEEFVTAGKTIASAHMDLFCGGKGFNQAVALHRAGNEVFFAGAVGQDGDMLLEALKRSGIDSRYVQKLPCSTGHAVIQVDRNGQNCIIILAGSNGEITEARVDEVLADFGRGDLIVLQNEISSLSYILKKAHEKGMTVAFNPSPFNSVIAGCDLSCVDYLLINETEGRDLADVSEPEAILSVLRERWPEMAIVLTLGEDGSLFMDKSGTVTRQGIYKVKAVDTTAAGDTFTGFFLSEMLRGGDAARALKTAAAASGLAVSRKGAEPSIPTLDEVLPLL